MSNKALLIGINAYNPPNTLHGCVNDVTDVATFLTTKCGFARGDITLITDTRATTVNIKTAIKALISGAKVGDRLYLHYSGHGTQLSVKSVTGVTTVHDAICPVDFDWTLQHAVLDTDFQELFQPLMIGVEFIFVSDSCHSGDLTRDFEAPHLKARYLEPPHDIKWNLEGAKEKGFEPLTIGTAVTTATVHDNVGFISGCRSNQTSADAVFNNRPNGAATYYLLKQLNSMNGLTEPLTAFVPSLDKALQMAGYTQQPQLHGPDNIISKPFLTNLVTPAPTATSAPAVTAAPVQPTPAVKPAITVEVIPSVQMAPKPTKAPVLGKSGIVNPKK